ncbi:MAG: SMP-30/gluconolactonase/LRE family protein, partial [Terriglobia bacterium]
QPNGLAFSPDGKLLYVDDSAQLNIRVFHFHSDGTLSGGRVFGSENDGLKDGVPDGMKVDLKGNLFVVGPKGIWVWDARGHHLGTIVLPEQPANLTWGGPSYHTLYITASTSVYKIQTRTRGFVPYLASQNDPHSARPYALLGLTLARQHDLHGALQNMRRAHDIAPDNADYAYDYAVLLLQDGQFATAIPILESLHRRSPGAEDILVNLARAYAGAAAFQKLSAILQNLPSADFSNLQLLKTLAGILVGARQTSAAARLWQAAIHDEPNQPLAYASLAELWIAQGEATKALALLNGAPAVARGSVYFYAFGETQMALKNYEKAVPVFRNLTRRFPQNRQAWEQLVRCNLLAGHLH